LVFAVEALQLPLPMALLLILVETVNPAAIELTAAIVLLLDKFLSTKPLDILMHR
jgi:hypothetical protein